MTTAPNNASGRQPSPLTPEPRIYVGPTSDPTAIAAVERGGGRRALDLDGADGVVWTDPAPDGFPDPVPPSVQWVQLPMAGVERWLRAGILDGAKATFTSARGAYSGPVAEHALALLLAGARELHLWAGATSWSPRPTAVLEGAVVTIVGCGAIGSALVQLLQPLRARCVAVTRSGREVPGAETSIDSTRLREWWRLSDYVVLAAPATDATNHLIGRSELAQLPPHAWLVNIARGSLVDTQALVEALESATIRGAALDVTDPEPLPDGHPLWSLPNALVTPHVANPLPTLRENFAQRISDNVRRFRAGDPLLGVIDSGAGY